MIVIVNSLMELGFMQLATAGFLLFFVVLFSVSAAKSLIGRQPTGQSSGLVILALLATYSLIAPVLDLPLTMSFVLEACVPFGFVFGIFLIIMVEMVKYIVQRLRNPRQFQLSVAFVWLGLAGMATAVLLASPVAATFLLSLSESSGADNILLRGDLLFAVFLAGLLVNVGGAVWGIVLRRAADKRKAAEMRIALANQGTNQIT